MIKKIIPFMLITGLSGTLFAGDFGSSAVEGRHDYSLQEMLQYAMEDEHMALAEYEALMEEFGLTRPYSNIAESEKNHISWLEGLYKNYNLQIPDIDVAKHLVMPSNPYEAAEIGVQAELSNIAMYEVFLKQELPGDVREVFIRLKNGSENHLKAFQRQLSQGGGQGKNRA